MAQIRITLDALLARPAVEIAARRPARGVLIPSYASLQLRVPRLSAAAEGVRPRVVDSGADGRSQPQGVE
jgi:hypothetical protein